MNKFFSLTATLFFLCALPLLGMLHPSLGGVGGGGLFAQSTVQVENASVNYATKQVTFRVKWTDQSTPEHRNKVWIFVDYQEVNGVNAAASWTPATITGATTVSAGAVSEQNARGFYLEGSITNFESVITVTLSSGTPAKFNWCAYTTDYPPNATISNGTYTLKGSAPFLLNGNIPVDATTYSTGQCVTSITDRTGCPGIMDTLPFSAGAIATTGQSLYVGSEPTIINSLSPASGGDGRYSYQWYKNSDPISGATATAYTPPTADATTKGTTTYTRKVNDGTCHTSPVQSAGSWVLIVDENTINLFSDAQTENQTVCQNAPITDIVYTTTGATSATVNGLPAGTTYTWNSGKITISGAPTTAGTFNYTISLIGGGGNATDGGTIIVNPTPTFTASADPATICSGESTILTVNATDAASYSFDDGSNWQTSPTLTATPTSTTNYIVKVRSAEECEAVAAQTVTVTVNALPTITRTSGSNNQTVSQGETINNIVYNTTNATGVNLSGSLPSGVSGSLTGQAYTIKGTVVASAATGAFTYSVRAITNACTSTTALNGTITVNSCDGCTYSPCTATDDEYNYFNAAGQELTGSASGYTMVHDAGTTTMNWETAAKYCRDKNMRLPTRNELRDCLCPLEQGYLNNYWSGTFNSGSTYTYYIVGFSNCDEKFHYKGVNNYVKCVK
jgi:hypothetical protein